MRGHGPQARVLALVCCAWLLLVSAPALAQGGPGGKKARPKTSGPKTNGAVTRAEPAPVEPKKSEAEVDVSAEVNLQDVVMAAMKSATTVQEAPAIVSVITDQRIKQQGYRFLHEAVGDVPGFFSFPWVYGFGDVVIPRGVLAGVLLLRDGVNLFDAGPAAVPLAEGIPMEMIKRVEVTSGPGGVLWGANSFVGVINVISKTADDLQGVEASVGGGTGPGRPGAFRTYVMGGHKFFSGKLKVLAHVSYETWHHAELNMPNQILVRQPAPNPMNPALLGEHVDVDTNRSHMIVASGNVQLGPIALYWHIPWGQVHRGVNFGGGVIQANLDEDNLDCTNPRNKDACDKRVDPNKVGRTINFPIYDQLVMLRYRNRFLDDKLGMEARAFYVYFHRDFDPYTSSPPSQILHGGAVANLPLSTHRAGIGFDGDLALPWRRTRILFGGDFFADIMVEQKTSFESPPETMALLPYNCPDDEGDAKCPMIQNFESNRLVGGLFLAAQSRPFSTLILDAGARLQLTGGKRGQDPVVLLSGAAVWSFMPNWHLKINYAEGYRPPALQKTDSNGEAMTFAGNAELEVERSRAIQGEINARLLRNYGVVRQLGLRANYSYTWITDFIDTTQGMYRNVSEVGIHSAELLAQLALKRGHWFALGYTFLDMSDAEKGKLRSIPNQWLTARLLLNLWKRRFFLSSNLSIFGSLEDPNRYANSPGVQYYTGKMENGEPVKTNTWTAHATDLTMDRVGPAAVWNAGLRYLLPQYGIRLDADVYNLLNANHYNPEGFMDLNSGLEMMPNPRPGISFIVRGQYRY